MTSPESMFDAEVIAELRQQFNQADKDGSGEIDAMEACTLFARCSDPGATEDEIRRTADSLRHQIDADRSGTISFNEYCFRFGRRYQMELNRRKRSQGSNASTKPAVTEADRAEEELRNSRAEIEREREALKRERERLELEKEREALRREREALERERQQHASSGSAGEPRSSGGASAGSSGASQNEEARRQPFSNGARVRIQGLQSAPGMNGKTATVLRYDDAAGRYVIEIDEGLGQKSLRPDNLVEVARPSGFSSSGFSEGAAAFFDSAKANLKTGVAKVQVWVATSGYEWWQIVLGIGAVLVVITAVMQASARHSGGSSSRRSHTSRSTGSTSGGYSSNSDSYDHVGGSQHYDDYDYDDYGYGGGGGGFFSGFDLGSYHKYIVIGGLGYLCWKGIIPVHRMDWFQMMMLWNFIQSTGILGGGGGRRRRGFF
eukprot:TRINITY_DN3226_c1_g1_i1.p1 TRINITY_DN3226_c1_g1~~TRINITY_DN3226_c1_g1_i1.p1  ORF type:complete len:434 (-),score=92.32 TRINITY_DN3226_c1_g1_i1:336-1637(-)